MKRIKIPEYAKKEAKEALRLRDALPESRKFGLDKSEASKLGINSGVERAKQIVNSTYLYEQDMRSVANFHNRFKNCRTFKCNQAIKLWGGRKFGIKVIEELKK